MLAKGYTLGKGALEKAKARQKNGGDKLATLQALTRRAAAPGFAAPRAGRVGSRVLQRNSLQKNLF